MANRAMAAKVIRAKNERAELARMEYSKPDYMRTQLSDAQALSVALVSRADIVAVGGATVRRFESGKTLRQVLRSHF
jgi:hypothetical protein